MDQARVFHDRDLVTLEYLRQLDDQPVLVFFDQHGLRLEVGWQVELVDEVLEELLRLPKDQAIEYDEVLVPNCVVDQRIPPVVLEQEVGHAQRDAQLRIEKLFHGCHAGLNELMRENVQDFP